MRRREFIKNAAVVLGTPYGEHAVSTFREV